MNKKMRMYTTYLGLTALLLAVSMAGWASPTVTINQAVGQADPTSTAPIHFTVVFSEAVTDFAAGDVTLTGTAPGKRVRTVTGSGTTYDVGVALMTGSGTVIANLAAGVAHNAAGNASTASTSIDNTVTYGDVIPLNVTINQAVGQADPTSAAPIHFTVVFSKVVTDFAASDVTLTGTPPGTLVGTVTGTGKTYDVAVTGMTGSGTVIANMAAGVAHDASGNASTASTSTDNTVTYDDVIPLNVTINQAGDQADPTNDAPIHFTVVFSHVVTDFAASDVTLTGTVPGTLVRTVTGTGATYDVAITGMTGGGTVIANLAAGVAHNAAGNASTASTSTDNTVTYGVTSPTVTINQAVVQADPTNVAPIHFTVVFSDVVTDFAPDDVTLTGTVPGTLVATVTGTGATYDVAITGMTGGGTVIANLAAGVAHDASGNASTASSSTDNTVTYGDVILLNVTINQAVGQADPTNAAPIHFTVVFSEVVTDFAAGDVTLTGTAPGKRVRTVTGSGTTYDVGVGLMTGSGTVIANLAAGVAHDVAGNASTASTSTDNTVTYGDVIPLNVTINQAVSQADPTIATPIHFTVVFSKVVTDFAASDVTLTGTAPGTLVRTVTGTGKTYDVAVTGMTGSGTVIADLAAGVAHDAAGNASTASTSTDNTVTFDLLGSAASFGAFGGGAGITNEGIYTVIDGDIGTTAECSLVTGFYDSTGDVYTAADGYVTGRIYAAPPPPANPGGPAQGGTAETKAIADAAFADALSAWIYLAGLPTTGPDPSASGELSGLTLAPGVYKAAGDTFNIEPEGTLTLDALGDPNAVWVFQIGASLTVGDTSDPLTARVIFKDGVGDPKNVYWQVGAAATINTGAEMVGTIIASAGVTFSTPGEVRITTLEGRALGLYASVTMVNTVINVP